MTGGGNAPVIRVLCVDDHVEILRLFALVLKEQQGIELLGTLDSADLLEQEIAAARPDVVVLDMSMPGRKPLAAMQAALSRFPAVRFLVTSSHDDPRLIEQVLDAGAHGYLVKGAAFDDLAPSIRRVCELGRPAPRSDA